MHAKRHQIVHQVVARRHAVEHRAHHPGLFAAGDGPETEIDLFEVIAHDAPIIARGTRMPELPEVETVMRGLPGPAGGAADRSEPRQSS